MSTEAELRDWRGGQVYAERLCAGVLAIDGYIDIDPQAPLGGPDGKKDLLARRSGKLFVGAAYFPPTHPTFAEIKRKYVQDRAGVERNIADGFVFFVNQPLTIDQRRKLLDLGSIEDEIYHLERLRSALDSPQGYGLRLEFLRRAMTVEEQIAFFSTLQQDTMQKFLENERRAEQKMDEILQRTSLIMDYFNIEMGPSSIHADLVGEVGSSMAKINISDLQLLHRAITYGSGMPPVVRGQIRGVQVWIGSRDRPIFIPPPAGQVPAKLAELLDWWREAYFLAAKGAEKNAVVAILAKLHYGIVSIHPFVDANGRLARLITDQAARELLKRGIDAALTEDHELYFKALESANHGNMGELEGLIRAAIE